MIKRRFVMMTISEKQIEKYKIISAFRKYTRLGLATQKLSLLEVYERIRGVCKSEEEALDLLAVYDTVRLLKLSGKNDIIKAVRAIYFSYLKGIAKKNDISLRVIRYAYENHCDERTVYRQLQYARHIYKLVRTNLS